MKKFFNIIDSKDRNKSKIVNINKINNNIRIMDNSLLDEIYNIREETLINISEQDEEKLEKVLIQRKLVNQEIEAIFNKIKNNENLVEDIKKAIQKKMTVEYQFNSYYNEKFYKARI